jgi:hypothetical protein
LSSEISTDRYDLAQQASAPVDSSTHVIAFTDFFEALDALKLLVRHGYRRLEGSLERLAPKTARLVDGKALGLPRGRFVVVWMDEGGQKWTAHNSKRGKRGSSTKGSGRRSATCSG